MTKLANIPFSKYSGCGNVFVIVDCRSKILPLELVPSICQCESVDGVITLENSQQADFRMRIFNADGSEAEMCGNGLRCFGLFLKEVGEPGDSFKIEVMEKIYPIEVLGNRVIATMPPAQDVQWNLTVLADNQEWTGDYLDTGVPHFVLYVDNIEDVPVTTAGRTLRHHPQFAPRGVNVDFVTLSDEGIVNIRTYERGVEAETLACGTGAAAAAISATRRYKLKNPVMVKTRSGEILEFDISQDSHIIMKGPACKIFSGFLG